MKKFFIGFLLFSVPILSGCSFPGTGGGIGQTNAPSVSFARSSDGGVTFESKSKIDDKTDFGGAEVIAVAFNPKDTRSMIVGTKESGIFASDNSGDSWKKITYPPTKVYGLTIDAFNTDRLFATGEWQGTGKVYRSLNGGEKWDEVYTEPTGKTTITALAQDPFHADTLYVGTSAGMVIRTNDGGQTWKNIDFAQSMQNHIIWNIAFDTRSQNTLYFLVDGLGVFVTDGEKVLAEPSGAGSLPFSGLSSASSSGAVSLALDSNKSGVLYTGTSKGLFRSSDYGKTWDALNLIESSKQFPIRALAVNPKNSNEIAYVAGLTFYKSLDGGVRWSTHQIASDKSVSFIRYDAYDPKNIYIGFKK